MELNPKTTTTQGIKASQQIVNNESTDSQQVENVEVIQNSQTVDKVKVSGCSQIAHRVRLWECQVGGYRDN
ncbi:MAG: hypothetical protein ACRDEA_17800 [Microcystaceae cyanobacterium]